MNFELFIEKYQKIPVEEFPNSVLANNPKPMVSVKICTFNHVKYIRESLNSILGQQTEFNFEILLGDDESDDGTREICIEYAKKNPNRIRLFLHRRENNIYLNGGPTGRFNTLYSFYHSRGKYIAICDGDDYWVDKNKLQKQFNLLESNNDLSFTFHSFYTLKDTKLIPSKIKEAGEVYGLRDVLRKMPNKFSTTFFRNLPWVHNIPHWVLGFTGGDLAFTILCCKYGKGRFIPDFMAVYRDHGKGIASSMNHISKIRNFRRSRYLLLITAKDLPLFIYLYLMYRIVRLSLYLYKEKALSVIHRS